MADLVFVCVREDVAYAEALAEMFDAEGFSIGARAGDAAAVRVLLWSPEACQSRAFHRAATAALAVGPVLVASVGTTPAAPEGVEAVNVFDLLDWDGDPESRALTPLRDAAAALVEPRSARLPEPAQQVWSGARVMGAGIAAPSDPLDATEPVERSFAPARPPAMATAIRAFAMIALVGGVALTAHLFTGVTSAAVPASQPTSLETAFASARAVQNDPSYTPDAPRHTLASMSLRDVVVAPVVAPARVAHRRTHPRAAPVPQINFEPAAYMPAVASEIVAPTASTPIAATQASAKPGGKPARI
jgi:hypothetical protein